MEDNTNTSKKTILIVEDEPLLLEAIKRKLDTTGFLSVGCSGGIEAIEYLKKAEKLPDAIWLDYSLRDMDGLAFMGLLKQNKACDVVPVIVVSNSASENKVKSMIALGAKEYVLKADHRLEEIIKIVSKFIV